MTRRIICFRRELKQELFGLKNSAKQFVTMLYRQIPMIKEMIDAVPFNNLMPYQLSEKLSCKDSETLWKEICHSQSIHKLSWKSEVPNDTDSVYSNRVVKNRKEI